MPDQHTAESLLSAALGGAIAAGPLGDLPGNMPTDLGGKNALLSDHFVYLGDAAPMLPENLRPIAQNRQGHRVNLNKDFVGIFIKWLEELGIKPCTLVGKPLMRDEDAASRRWCATCRADDDEQDEEVRTVSVAGC